MVANLVSVTMSTIHYYGNCGCTLSVSMVTMGAIFSSVTIVNIGIILSVTMGTMDILFLLLW